MSERLLRLIAKQPSKPQPPPLRYPYLELPHKEAAAFGARVERRVEREKAKPKHRRRK